MREKDEHGAEIGALKEELEGAKMSYEKHCLEFESKARETKTELEQKIEDLESFLKVSMKKTKELEEIFENKIQNLKNREIRYHSFVDSHFGSLQV